MSGLAGERRTRWLASAVAAALVASAAPASAQVPPRVAPPSAVRAARVVKGGGHALERALAAARPGDVLEVEAGTYDGPLRIDRPVVLHTREAVIDGHGRGTVLRVNAPGVVVEGFTIRHSGTDLGAPDACLFVTKRSTGARIAANTLERCTFGMWIDETSRVRIEHNRVVGASEGHRSDRGNGIHLFNASRARVEGNEVTDGRDGIYVSATEDSVFLHNRLERTRYGVHYMYSLRNTLEGNVASNSYSGFALMQSSHIVVRDNVAADNEHDGILFRDAQDCQIVGNRLERNGEGLFFFSSTRNVIADNQVVNNDIGARVWAGSVRNEVTRNVLVGNRQQVFYVGAEDLRWGADRGNYWSDYLGWDQDGDGIGERPYRMDSFSARLIHRFPSASVLLRSPALELLSQLERTVPILRVPTIIDERPLVSGKR